MTFMRSFLGVRKLAFRRFTKLMLATSKSHRFEY